MALTDTNKNRIGKRRPSGPWKVPQSDSQPSGPKLPKRISGGPAFQPTKADDRGYRKGGKLRTEYAKGGPGKFRYELDGDLDNTGRAGYAGGGTLASMRKNIIGIKKDRGLTAKSGARTGMTKKRATGRGGR